MRYFFFRMFLCKEMPYCHYF